MLKSGSSVSSKAFCYESKILEGLSWAIFIMRLSCPSLRPSRADRRHSAVFPGVCDYVGQQVPDSGMAAHLGRGHYQLTLVWTIPWVPRAVPTSVISGPSSQCGVLYTRVYTLCGTKSEPGKWRCRSTPARALRNHLARCQRGSASDRTKTRLCYAQHIVKSFLTVSLQAGGFPR